MKRRSRGIVEATLAGFADAASRVVAAEGAADRRGVLQALDPRAKLLGFLSLVIAGSLAHRIEVIAALLVVSVALALLSRVSIRRLLAPVWLGSLGLTLAIAMPALVLTPGDALWSMPGTGWAVTRQGLTSAVRLLLRVETAATVGFVLVFTTRWPHVLKALRSLRVPAVFVVILGMTYRYILLILETAHAMFEGRRSRQVGRLHGAEARRATLHTAGVLLGKTMDMSGEVYLAMQARGFRGEAHVLDDFRMTARDWFALGGLASIAAVAAWMGR